MYDTPLTVEQNLTLLADTPSRLARITKGLSAAQLVTPPELGEWSARDVLAHLRACSDMWGKYMRMILFRQLERIVQALNLRQGPRAARSQKTRDTNLK